MNWFLYFAALSILAAYALTRPPVPKSKPNPLTTTITNCIQNQRKIDTQIVNKKLQILCKDEVVYESK